MSDYYATVILPLALPKNYTYRIPEQWLEEAIPGKRVAVQFGKSRIYSALVYELSESPPQGYRPKDIIEVLDDEPIVDERQLRLWEWIAAYYMCTLGEVMTAALPASLKLSSQTKVILNQDFTGEDVSLNDKEQLIYQALRQQHELSLSDISRLLGQKTVMPLVLSLMDKKALFVSEQLSGGYRPKTQAFLRLHPVYQDDEKLRELFEILERAPRQLDALMTFIHHSGKTKGMAKNTLMQESGVSAGVIHALTEKEIFISEQQEVSRLKPAGITLLKESVFSEEQAGAFTRIKEYFAGRQTSDPGASYGQGGTPHGETSRQPAAGGYDVVLLHGVTSSGKTLIYIRLIEEYLRSGGQVLLLLPEIALTTQMTERLQQYFGRDLAVYHSRFNDNERGEIWKKVQDGTCRIIMGARSALFLPFDRLGLVIVDEEHENSYKQFDPAPRYHARDVAIYLAGLHGAKTLLGTATPSLESYYHAQNGKYGFVPLFKRYGDVRLPGIQVVDMLKARKRRRDRNPDPPSLFSPPLMDAIQKALEQREQVILFKNRRGYVPVTMCATCGHIPQCMHCDISLTYHRSSNQLVCHYCGFTEKPFHQCPACGSSHMVQKGFGTEKVEEELQLLLPEARIARLDLDSTRSRYAFQQLLNDFEAHKTDILVGTQMVTKGLDFARVSLVGILDADSLLRYPDFRAFERGYQLITQVSGRAGRRDRQGKVLIQTYSPEHKIIQMVIGNQYESFYQSEIREREQFRYPPFRRLIRLNLKHKNNTQLHEAARLLGISLKKQLGKRVLGPQTPLVSRIRTLYIESFLIKVNPAEDSLSKVKQVIRHELLFLQSQPAGKGVLVQLDVDPM